MAEGCGFCKKLKQVSGSVQVSSSTNVYCDELEDISDLKILLSASAGHWKRCVGPHVARRPLFAHPCPRVYLDAVYLKSNQGSKNQGCGAGVVRSRRFLGGVGNFGKSESGVGYFTSDSATLLKTAETQIHQGYYCTRHSLETSNTSGNQGNPQRPQHKNKSGHHMPRQALAE